jgi:hypothetical protein
MPDPIEIKMGSSITFRDSDSIAVGTVKRDREAAHVGEALRRLTTIALHSPPEPLRGDSA